MGAPGGKATVELDKSPPAVFVGRGISARYSMPLFEGDGIGRNAATLQLYPLSPQKPMKI